jgi:hypothetical protein
MTRQANALLVILVRVTAMLKVTDNYSRIRVQ